MSGRGEWSSGGSSPARSKRRRAALGAVGLFIVTASVGGLIGSKTTDTFDRITADQPDPLTVTIAQVRSGGSKAFEVRAGSSTGIPSVSSADSYLFARSVDDMPTIPPEVDIYDPGCEGWRAWAKSEGGIDANATYISVYVIATGSGPLILENAQVEVVARSPPIRGVHAYCPIQALLSPPRLLSIDLDEPTPAVEYTVERNNFRRERKPFGFFLRHEEVEHFLVLAHTEVHYVRWRLRFTYLLNGQRHLLIVSDKDGSPFKTSATSNAARVGYSVSDGWSRSPPPPSRNPIKRQPPLSYYY